MNNFKDCFFLACSLIIVSCTAPHGQRRGAIREGDRPGMDQTRAEAPSMPSPAVTSHVPAPEPAPLEDPLRAPDIKRTSVVIDNGMVLPTLSFWLRYDPKDPSLTAMIEFMQKYHPDPLLTMTLADGLSALCVDDSLPDTYYLSVILGHLAHYSPSRGISFLQSIYACDVLPKFKALEDVSHTVMPINNSRSHFTCTSEAHITYELHEKILNIDGLALFQSIDSEQRVTSTTEFTHIEMLAGPTGAPQLTFGDAPTTFTIEFYRPRGDHFLGRLADQDLECIYE